MTRHCWTPLGPACVLTQKGAVVSGRFTSIVIDPSDATGNTVIAGAAGGTLWKTIDAGVTWSMLEAEPLAGLSISALAAHTGSLLAVGTGEAHRSMGLAGDGVRVRKPDGTWERQNLDPALRLLGHKRIVSLVVEPDGAFANIYAGTAPTNVFRSRDLGKSWEELMDGEFFSLVRANDRILGGRHGDGVYTLEAGLGRLGTGLPDANPPGTPGIAKIVLAVAPSSPQIVYALYTKQEPMFAAGALRIDRLFRSEDTGDSWTEREFHLSDDSIAITRDTLQMVVHPTNPEHVYIVHDGTIHRSLDGGSHWDAVELGDLIPLALAISPVSPFPAWIATTNGIYVAPTEGTRTSGTARWEARNRGLFALQVTSLAQHPTERSVLLGATREHGAIRHRSHPLWKGAESAKAELFLPSFQVAVDPNRPTHWYTTTFHPDVSRSKDGGATWQLMEGIPADDKASLIPPLAIDPRHAGIIYYGSTGLFRWDEAHVAAGWVEIARFEEPLVAIAHAAPFPPDWTPSDHPVETDPPPVPTQWIYVATASEVFRVEEHAGTFRTVGPFKPHYSVQAGRPKQPFDSTAPATVILGFQDQISSLRADPDDPEAILVTVGGPPLSFRDNQRGRWQFTVEQLAARPELARRVWGSGTGGRHWGNVELDFTPEERVKESGLHERNESVLPVDVSVYKVVVDPEVRGRMFLATDRGVLVSSVDDLTSGRWDDFTDNLPRVPVADLAIFKPLPLPFDPDAPPVLRVLRAATFGAGVWERVLDEEPGPCEGDDFYLRDNILDTGEVATAERQPDPVSPAQSRTVLDAIDIKIDRDPFLAPASTVDYRDPEDPAAVADFIGFELAEHEAPQAGNAAHVSLQIHNRGPSAGVVRARILYTTRDDDSPPRDPNGTFPPGGIEGWHAVGDVQQVTVQPGLPAVVRWTALELPRNTGNKIRLLACAWSPVDEPFTFPVQSVVETAAADKRVSLGMVSVLPPPPANGRGWFRWWMVPVALGAVVLVLDVADVEHLDLGLI
jgi:hypothetical protein